jgi:hypothetical protein
LKRAGIVRIYQSKEKQVVWDWYRSAEYILGEDLKYNKIEGVTLSENELLEKLKQYNMEHLIDQ